MEEVQKKFADTFAGVSAEEISQAEQALIEGGLPVSEVQRLCDVHAAVFKDSIAEIHAPKDLSVIPGHPAYLLKLENKEIKAVTKAVKESLQQGDVPLLAQSLKQLLEIDKHYKKKENLIFPFMEKYGITAPPKVMWGVDDEIRQMLKQSLANLEAGKAEAEQIDLLVFKIDEMVFKEENILLPILYDNLTPEEWAQIAKDSEEFGYTLLKNVPAWQPVALQEETPPPAFVQGGITLPTGSFSIDELAALLNLLPVDITFVDKEDRVRYFSQGKERVFPRTVSVLGRNVSNCHPPASVHVVEKIVEDFKTGKKDEEKFWLRLGDKYIYICYFAVRGAGNEYLGVLEVTQNIAPIQEIEGEKRLVSNQLACGGQA